jgi:hypothetical protein
MKKMIACLPALLYAVSAIAQESPPDSAAPGESHAALVRLAGDWEAHATFWAWQDQSTPSMECTVTVSARMVMGGRFLLQNVQGQCMDQPVEAIGVIGYDNATGQYQAVDFDNMRTNITRHIGEMNDVGDIVFHLSYTDRTTGESVDRRTVRTMISEREWVETAHESRNRDERQVMEIRATKVERPVP